MYQIQFQNLMAANYLQQTMAGRGQTTQSSLLTTSTPSINTNVISITSDSPNVNIKRKLLTNKKYDQEQDNHDNNHDQFDQSQDINDNKSDDEQQQKQHKLKKTNRMNGNGKVDQDLIKLNKKNKSKPSTIHHNHVY